MVVIVAVTLNMSKAKKKKKKKITEIASILQIHDLLVSRLRQRDPDSTPLHMAVRRNQTFIVQLLLEHAANPAARDHFGLTPLHLAAIVGNLEVNVRSILNSSLAFCIERMDSFFIIRCMPYVYQMCFMYFAIEEPNTQKDCFSK